MPASIRIKPLDRSALFAPGAGLDPARAARQVADFHRAQLAEAEAVDTAVAGHVVDHTDFVNGAVSDDFDKVMPGRSIVSVFAVGSEVVQAILDQLRAAAPVLTGAFRASISIYADGEQIEDAAVTSGAAEIVFLSTVPYARKIERGESSQAPDGVFEAVAAIAAARFGNQAKITFGYREPVGGANALEAWARKHSGKVEGVTARRRQYAKDVRQPAIVVTFR